MLKKIIKKIKEAGGEVVYQSKTDSTGTKIWVVKEKFFGITIKRSIENYGEQL